MPLYCECPSDDHEYFYEEPTEKPFEGKRGKRCKSCKTMVKPGELALIFPVWRQARTDIEDRIHGDEVPLTDRVLCETCGDLWSALEEKGFCLTLGDNMHELVAEYARVYGPKGDG